VNRQFLTLLLTFLGLTVPAVASPGPVSTAVVTAGARQGVRVGPLVSTGHAMMEFLMVLGLALGLRGLMEQPVVAGIIGLVGGVLMLYMGGSLIWGVWQGKLTLPGIADDEDALPATPWSLIGLGIVTTLSNPFWYGWWVSVGGSYVWDALQFGALATVVLYLSHITVDYLWNSFLAGVVGSGRRWMNNSVYHVLLVVAGMFLLYVGVTFMIRAADVLDLSFWDGNSGAAFVLIRTKPY
jgi:threonine/homoserine/homoserine lactone efflux protein